jgi:hypothetical protein
MGDQDKPDKNYSVTIGGGVSGQFIQGDSNVQIQSTAGAGQAVTDAELTELRAEIDRLRQAVATTAPPDIKDAALERVNELEDAVTAKEPDLDAMGGVKSWFVKRLPGLAGAVTGIFINPILGKLVEAAGEGLAAEFRRRFGIE